MSEGQDEESKPTFRIRFTIHSGCGERHQSKQTKTNLTCNEDIYNSSDHHKENKNQKCNCKLDANLSCNCCRNHTKKAFKFIQPHSHKSSLFVSLSDSSRNSSLQLQQQEKKINHHLFVSPDLDHFIPASPPILASDSTLPSCATTPSDLFRSGEDRSSISGTRSSFGDSTMSHGCNFINWSSAARRRSSSVTRSNNAQTTSTTTDNNNGRRASSSHDLAAPANPLANTKSTSGNHLAVGMSNETICDLTTTNRRHDNGAYLKHSDINRIQPLDIQVNVPVMSVEKADHPIGLDDILQVDMETLRLEEECRMLESQVQYWEDKVEQMEREKFKRTASRSLIDKLIQKRKNIRDLDFQLFKLNLEVQDSDCLSQKLSPLSDSKNPIHNSLLAGRYGSQIKPGQENTADILDAIPPSGQLQHKQYLTKASTGTDHGDYSRIESRHRHFLPRRNCREPQAFVYVDSASRFSPVRPNHFNGDFLQNHAIVSEDSSSPASGDHPQ